MKLTVVLGRIFFTAVFLSGAVMHLTRANAMSGYAASKGVPMAQLMVLVTGLMLLVGSLTILFGFMARFGAWLLVLFLLPTTFMMHNFWAETDPMTKMHQMAQFQKNIALLGAALLITHFGSGPYSLDGGRKKGA